MKTFADLYRSAATVRESAAGRVNLIGEHTDYNGGFVLPTLIPQRCRVELAPRDDRTVRLFSGNFGGSVHEYRIGEERKSGTWIDYPQGVTWLLCQEGFRLGGFNVLIDCEVPPGSGLSSSA